MLFQQLVKHLRSIKVEDAAGPSLSPSITIAHNNVYFNNISNNTDTTGLLPEFDNTYLTTALLSKDLLSIGFEIIQTDSKTTRLLTSC